MKFKIALVLSFLLGVQFTNGKQHPKKLNVGDSLPSLILVDAFGDTTFTDNLIGHKILITFNRYVSCPLCNFRTHELLENYDSLNKQGLIFISF